MLLKIKLLLLTFLFIQSFSVINAQSNSANNNTFQIAAISNGWNLLTDMSGVFVYAQKVECNRPEDGVFYERVLLRFVNTTEEDLMIEWKLMVWYDGVLWTKVPLKPENFHIISLAGGASVEGACEIDSDYYDDLSLFSRFLNYTDRPEMTQFQLLDMNVYIQPN